MKRGGTCRATEGAKSRHPVTSPVTFPVGYREDAPLAHRGAFPQPHCASAQPNDRWMGAACCTVSCEKAGSPPTPLYKFYLSVCYLYKRDDVSRGQFSLRNKTADPSHTLRLSPFDSPNLSQLAYATGAQNYHDYTDHRCRMYRSMSPPVPD